MAGGHDQALILKYLKSIISIISMSSQTNALSNPQISTISYAQAMRPANATTASLVHAM